MKTVPVPVRLPVTVNALPAGREPASSALSKVTVSSFPFTDALSNAGGAGALLVTVWPEKVATGETCLPTESCSGLVDGLV